VSVLIDKLGEEESKVIKFTGVPLFHYSFVGTVCLLHGNGRVESRI